MVRTVPCRSGRPRNLVRSHSRSGRPIPGYPQRDKAQDFVVDNQVTYPSIYDPPMRTLAALGGNYPTSVIPSTLVLDRQHRVAGVFLKALLADDLTPVIERVASE